MSLRPNTEPKYPVHSAFNTGSDPETYTEPNREPVAEVLGDGLETIMGWIKKKTRTALVCVVLGSTFPFWGPISIDLASETLGTVSSAVAVVDNFFSVGDISYDDETGVVTVRDTGQQLEIPTGQAVPAQAEPQQSDPAFIATPEQIEGLGRIVSSESPEEAASYNILATLVGLILLGVGASRFIKNNKRIVEEADAAKDPRRQPQPRRTN